VYSISVDLHYSFCTGRNLQIIFSLFQAPPKQVPRTIESTRLPDETMVAADDEEVTHRYSVI
jgi:hypothetical protein